MTMKELVSTDKYKEYFGEKEFALRHCGEIHQLLYLNFATKKQHYTLGRDLIAVAREKQNLDQFMNDSDEQLNNLMHLTEGKFADK